MRVMDMQTGTPPTRRMGNENSKTRALLLDSAEQLMREEGYAAVTSRRLAAYAGLKPQLVHYYFRTMDDLFLDLFNRVADGYLVRLRALLASRGPLQALWDIACDHDKGVLTVEFMALANHRKTIRAAIAEYGERSRDIQREILHSFIDKRRIDAEKWPPVALAFILECVARALVIETNLGATTGHAEVLALLARLDHQLAELPPSKESGPETKARRQRKLKA